MASGSHRSRPMEKATRDDAMTVALSADMVDSSPPNTITATPKAGMNPSAARTIAVSPYSPRNCQEGCPSGPGAAASDTNRMSRYITTVIASEMNVAWGIVLLGILDLLRHGGDQVVALERDEREPHGHDHSAEPLGKERREGRRGS